MTINSQPPVNGVPSSHKMFGWGPRGGYVYQKEYIEFFASPEQVHRLMEVMRKLPSVTYHAVNLQGNKSFTNTKGTNAVTWGVFPGSEIVQPTVVDAASFVVWKDEARAVWRTRWMSLYDPSSPSYKLLETIINTYFIVNIVDNNYIDGDILKVFLEAANVDTSNSSVTNHTNGC